MSTVKPIRFTKNCRDLSGDRYGMLVVRCLTGRDSNDNLRWLCDCDCGGTVTITTRSIRRGRSDCGCANSERVAAQMRTHGMSSSTEYRIWYQMIRRCTYSRSSLYEQYGGRGITVCDRWLNSFENFYDDMGPRPSKRHSIDRINNNGNYEPDNCRWATTKTQQRNTRATRMLTLNGETLSLPEWAERIGVSHRTLYTRLRRGLPVERILNPANLRSNRTA